MDVVLVYAGLLGMLVGFVSVLKPLRFLGLRRRRSGGAVLGLGLLVGLLGALLPASLKHSSGTLLIDRFMPDYQFNEIHSFRIRAPADRIFRAIRQVTPREIRWARTLSWIRSLPARLAGKAEPKRGDERRPILEPRPGSASLVLAEEPGREMVFGLVGQFWRPAGGEAARIEGPEAFLAFDRPGYVKATLNFSLRDEGGGWCRLTTETRVFASDAPTRRRFAAYWRVIYPGSALLRRTWLAAIKRRAEGVGT